MLRIAQMINPEEIPKSFRPRSSPFSTAETICWWVNPFWVWKTGAKRVSKYTIPSRLRSSACS